MSKDSLEHFDNVMDQLEALQPADLDSLLNQVVALTPWQGAPAGADSMDPRLRDEDGFSLSPGLDGDFNYQNYSALQKACWAKFNQNPFIFTTTTDATGRLTGFGFWQTSQYDKVNAFMKKTWTDPRNMLISHFSKYVARALIQGELFLVLTLHDDGFVEVDFLSPSVLKGFGDNSGILTAPGKPLFHLMYSIQPDQGEKYFLPSINMAYYPELWSTLTNHPDKANLQMSKIRGKKSSAKYKEFKGYSSFVVAWDQGFVTKRNVGRAKVSLEWLEHYDNIKKWELDHKKSSGSYLWAIEIEDRAAFRLWLSLSEDEREKTGLMKTKVPGGTIMLPPGFKLTCHNPRLSSITNQDDDIKEMISAGLNTPEDIMTGSSKGQTYSGTKMSRGPVSDRIQDQIADLERFMIYTFWRGALWLHAKMKGLNWEYKTKKVYKFEDGEPKSKSVSLELHETIEISFPVSEMGDLEAKARALMGVKHGPVTETLGIPKRDVARALGFFNYHQARLDYATEEMEYPDLPLAAFIESAQAMQGEETSTVGGQEQNSSSSETDSGSPENDDSEDNSEDTE